jgi:hypothetical protein
MKTTFGLVFAALLSALCVARLLPERLPVPNRTDSAATAIEGVYANTHTVRDVDGHPASAEDVVEVLRYDPTHVFIQLVTLFDNGASCSLYGIATLENRAFVYRTRQFLPHDDPTCTLSVESTPEMLRVTDRLEPRGVDTCRAFCGVRGDLSDIAVGRKRRLLREDVTRLKNSGEYADAVEEFKKGNRLR